MIACGDDGGSTKAVDAPKAIDAPVSNIPVIHGCTEADYLDKSMPADSRDISVSSVYFVPKCLTIAVGQSVTVTLDFSVHPLKGGIAPSNAGDPPGEATTPFMETQTGQMATFGPFDHAGYYPYFCPTHESLGMIGVVRAR